MLGICNFVDDEEPIYVLVKLIGKVRVPLGLLLPRVLQNHLRVPPLQIEVYARVLDQLLVFVALHLD